MIQLLKNYMFFYITEIIFFVIDFIALCNYPWIKSYCLPKIICVHFRLILCITICALRALSERLIGNVKLTWLKLNWYFKCYFIRAFVHYLHNYLSRDIKEKMLLEKISPRFSASFCHILSGHWKRLSAEFCERASERMNERVLSRLFGDDGNYRATRGRLASLN